MMEHTCSYYCERPECIRAQRDELRDRLEKVDQGGAVAVGEVVAFTGSMMDMNIIKWANGYAPKIGDNLYLQGTHPHDPALAERLLKEFENCEDCESISSRLSDYVREAAAALGGGK